MSSYIVTKTINGRQYRYRQTTWREGGRMRTKSEYLGPVGGSARNAERPTSAITEFLRAVVRKRDRREDIGEAEDEARERVAREDAQRGRDDRVNDLLTGKSVTLDAVAEIADLQAGGKQEGESADSPGDASETSAE